MGWGRGETRRGGGGGSARGGGVRETRRPGSVSLLPPCLAAAHQRQQPASETSSRGGIADGADSQACCARQWRTCLPNKHMPTLFHSCGLLGSPAAAVRYLISATSRSWWSCGSRQTHHGGDIVIRARACGMAGAAFHRCMSSNCSAEPLAWMMEPAARSVRQLLASCCREAHSWSSARWLSPILQA